MRSDDSSSIRDLVRGDSLKHLAALNEIFGFEPPASEHIDEQYWIIRHDNNNGVSLTPDHNIHPGDHVLLFNLQSNSCEEAYTVLSISRTDALQTIELGNKRHFKQPVNIEVLSLNSIVSSNFKHSLLMMLDTDCSQIERDDFDIIIRMALTPIHVDVQAKTVKDILGADFIISNELLGQICAALNSGNHLILSGPPGTGKTTIAQAVAIAARGVEPIVTTATADWSTFDTVGGYMPDLSSSSPNALTFETGIVLQSMIDRRWIIIDEINRAPIDKAIGQLFTVLSGGDVLLPFRNIKSRNRLKIVSDNFFSNEDVYSRSDDWRLIATMNEYDKNALFDMSYAFMRRFAIIRVGLPDEYVSVIGKWCEDANIDEIIIDNIKSIISKHMSNREIGPAVFKSIIRYYLSRIKTGSQAKLYYAESLAIFLVPQLQGLEDTIIRGFAETIVEGLADDHKALELFKRSLSAFTSVVL